MIPFVDLRPAHAEIRLSIDAAIDRVRERGIFLNGPEVELFEEEWAAYCGQRFCVACASGTDALMLAAAGQWTTRFRIPANTLKFTDIGIGRNATSRSFDDVDERGWMRGHDIDRQDVNVLLYGRIPPFPVSRSVDACQAHGWKPEGLVDAAWSFYPTKNLGCFGDGGALTTDHEGVAKLARTEAALWHSRMSEINAAVLRTKLPHLDRWNAERAAIAEVYYNELPDWAEPACRPGEPTNHHIFAVLVERRDELEKHMLANNIGVKVHYREPLAELSGARRWCDRTLSLPCYPGLTPMQVQEVCDTMRSLG